eukprot:TRINITY_DN3922_c1_g1_i1.p1 TRINITY_DN3922_c1_g1~~TRINITY_DN3922_c1_g1_i1.p1  ORF type:complete len:591 (-),score=160.58 TRINITY_DN3922_c1_g1_i1:303-2075(-)
MTNLTNGVEMEAPIERRHHDGDVKKTRSKTGGESDKSKRGSKHSDRSPRKSKKSTSSKKSSFPLEEKTSYSVTFSPSSEPSSSPLLPLVDAVIKGNAADLADIVKSGQDVEAAGTSGMKDYEGVKAAPLFWAALLNQPVCVDALLKLGASLASTCIVLSPPSADSTRSFSKLLDFGGLTPLHGAIYRNNSDVAGMLIDAGADIKAVGGSEENNCVQFAAEKKAAETLRVIIEKSRDVATLVNAKNKMGETALHLGSVHKEKDTIEAILGVEGVQIEAINDVEQTPLHIAARSGSLDCVRLLLEKGASVNSKDIKGNTPLHLAAIGGYEAMVSLLIKKGAKVTEENLDNKTAMHLATEHGKDDVCYILTTNGADVSIRYQWGDSHRKVHSFEEDELIGMAKSANTFGFLEEDKRSKQTIAVKLDEEKVKKRERKRAQRWAPMVIEWDRWERKKYPQLSRRVYKGLPDSLRCECWKLLTHCKQYKIENPSINYHDLILQDSKWADQIDLDVNRSFRNHILFKERFGSGQVSLFNILKAYANYDKEVGYCQGMSDMTALLLMYVSEEDACSRPQLNGKHEALQQGQRVLPPQR